MHQTALHLLGVEVVFVVSTQLQKCAICLPKSCTGCKRICEHRHIPPAANEVDSRSALRDDGTFLPTHLFNHNRLRYTAKTTGN